MGFCNCSMFCYALLYVHSGFAIILMGKRELVALLSLYPWCLVSVVWLFLVVPWVCLQFVIVVFPDHTYFFWQTPHQFYYPLSSIIVMYFSFFSLLPSKVETSVSHLNGQPIISDPS